MADRVPLRLVNVNGTVTIGEFQSGDTVGVVHGGTGVSSIDLLKNVVGVDALSSYIAANEAMWSSDSDVSTLSGLGDTTFTSLSANQIIVWNGTAWVNEYNDKTEMRVRNGTASPMSKGDVIAIQNAHNQNLVNVVLADASQTSAMPALGILEQDLAVGEEGIAITFGKAQGLNTFGLTEGATAYVSPTTPGGIVDTRPTADNHLVQNIGIVMRAHPSNGAIKVTGIGRANDIPNDVSSNIASNTSAIENSAQLSDVSVELSSLVSSIHHGGLDGLGDNDHPQYVLSSTNSALSAQVDANTSAIDDAYQLSDIEAFIDHGNIAGLSDNDHPQYVLSSTNSALSAQVDTNTSAIDNALDLSDIVTYIEHGDLNGLGDNDHPQYVLSATNNALSSLVTNIETSTVDLSSYIASNESSWSTGTAALSGLTDTNISSPAHNESLVWTSATGEWINASVAGGGGVTDHGLLTGLADNDHPQYVLSSTNNALSSLVTSIETSTVDLSSYIASNETTWSTDNDTTDHTALSNIGTNTHAQIDSHIASGSVHFTEASIDHGSIAGLGDNDHPQYVLSSTNSSLSSTVTSKVNKELVGHYIEPWEEGSGHQNAPLGWSTNGTSSLREFDTDPFGNQSIIWKAIDTDVASDPEGGFNSGKVPADSSSLHRFSCFIKQENPASGTVYFGAYAYSSLSGTVSTDRVNVRGSNAISGTGNNNPYFISNLQLPSSDWYLAVAYLLPYQTETGPDKRQDTALYKASTGERVSFAMVDRMFDDPTAIGLAIRAYHYNNPAGTGDAVQFFQPRIDIVDGNEPSIADLLGIVPRTDYVLSSTNSALSSLVTNIETSTVDLSSYIASNETTWSTDNDTTDHTALSNIGTNTHAQIDSHIADSTLHFTEASIDHGSIAGLGDNDHPQYVLSATNNDLSTLVTNIETSTVDISGYIEANETTWSTDNDTTDHTALSNIGTNTHAQIDSHIASGSVHFTEASIDHGSIAGLADDDHPQYVLSATNNDLSTLVTNIETSTVDLSSYIASNETTWSTDSDTTDHTALSNIGTNTHAQIDSHIASGSVHFTEASIDHGSIAGLADNDHPQYVLSATNNALSSLVTSVEASTVNLSGYIAANETTWSTDNDTTDHTALSNIGTNTHAQIDSHIADSTIHFTEASIDHGSIAGLADNDHPQYVLSSTNNALSSLVTSIETSTVNLSGYIAANEGTWSAGGGGGVTDHGALTGLADNDHPQYVLSSTNAALSSLVTNTTDVSGIVHGNLSALTADDHTQYSLVDGTRPVSSITIHDTYSGTVGDTSIGYGIETVGNLTNKAGNYILFSATTGYQFRQNGVTTYTNTGLPNSMRNWDSTYNTVLNSSGSWGGGGGGGGVAAGITVVNTGTDNINTAGALVPLDTSTGYPAYGTYGTDYSYTAGNSYVTINTAGTYEVTFNVAYTTVTARWNGILKIYKGTGGASPSAWIGYGAGKMGYVRNSTGHNEASLIVTCLVTCSANDTIGGHVAREAANGTCSLVANETFMTIKRMA